MRFLRSLALLSILAVPAAFATPKASAQVSVGIGVGGPVYAAPACRWGYYGYAPYACAPYGYYGPEYFNGGLFIGAGPWFHGGYYGGYGYRGGYYGHAGYYGGGYRGGYGGGYRGGYAGGYHGGGYAGGGFHGGTAGGGFHGGASAGGGFHGGGGGFHGGGGGGHR